MSPRRARRLAGLIIFILIAATLLPPFINANRFRNRLADTISRSIGRPVTMGDLHFTLLPRPGFVASNFAIADDPAFSAEPVLSAQSVTASLRLTSLWRGRLEIARLSFESPSLNLVRSADGGWNVEPILRQASQVPAAPTATTRPESRPRFPYIEAEGGRINFREAQEKLPHALMDSDFALWLEAEDQWNMRLEGRPTRTDAHLSDTGTLRLSGQLRRAETLPATQMRVDIELESAQLGQWTSLLTGRDRGWRGSTDMQARLEGTISEFAFTANTEVANFRRYDVANPDSLDARIQCRGNVNLLTRTSARTVFDCALPLGKGTATVAGNIALRRDPDYDLQLVLRDVPAASLANLYRRVKRNVPEDLEAQGSYNGEYRFVSQPGGAMQASGRGRVAGLQLASASRGASFAFTTFDVDFVRPKRPAPTPVNELIVGSAGVRLGGNIPVYVAGKVSRAGMTLEAKGDAEFKRLMSAASLLGLADPRYQVSGFATFNLAVNGVFADFTAPIITGTAQLRETSTRVDGVAAPLVVNAATVQLTSQVVTIQRISARLEGTSTIVEGSVTIPRNCTGASCRSTFDLKTADLNLDDLNRVLNPRYRSTGWLTLPRNIFGDDKEPASRLMTLQSSGTIAIGRLQIKNLVAARASGRLTFDRGLVTLSELQAEFLSGKHLGDWQADLTGNEPVFSGKGMVEALPLAHVNALLRAPLGTGTVRLTYELAMRGSEAAALRRTTAGQATFQWTNGTWRTASGASPIQFSDWTGTLNIRDEAVDLTSSLMQTRTGPYQVSGRAGFNRELSLRLAGPRDQMLISGPLHSAAVAISPAEALPAADSASNLKNASPAKVRNQP